MVANAVATIEGGGGRIDQAAILKTLNLDVRSPQTQALLLICERYELDPLLKHLVLIQGSPYVTRDGYLAIAHRSGLFDGMEVLEQGETSTHFTAKVSVYRKDWGRPVTMIGRYPKSERMAKSYGPEMAVKVAEVAALRRAFNVTGVGAADERFDDEAVVDRKTGEVRPKSTGGSARAGDRAALPPAPSADSATENREEDTPKLDGPEDGPSSNSVTTAEGDGSLPSPEPIPPADAIDLEEVQFRLDQLDAEHKALAKAAWVEAGLPKLATLNALQAGRALNIVAGVLNQQKGEADKRRKAANAAMSKAGIKSDDARHEAVRAATGGATESTSALTAEQLQQIVAYCAQLDAEDEGPEAA